MSLKFDIFQINDLARVVPADMEIETFIGILWWAAAVVGERAAAEPLEPMSLPREPEAVAACDESFLLVEPDEPAGAVTIVVATADDAAADAAVDAATAAAIAAAMQSPSSDVALAEAEPASPATAEDFVADPAPAAPPPAAAADAPVRATSPLGAIWSKADDQRLVDMWHAGSSFPAIAAELQRSAQGVQHRLTRLRKSGEFGPLALRKRARSDADPQPKATPEARSEEPEAQPAASPAAISRKPTPAAAPARVSPAARQLPAAARTVYDHLVQLDDSFTPDDDLNLIRGRQRGETMEAIAEDVGSDVATVRDRWRAILKCKVESKGGIVTAAGHENLLAAATLRASA